MAFGLYGPMMGGLGRQIPLSDQQSLPQFRLADLQNRGLEMSYEQAIAHLSVSWVDEMQSKVDEHLKEWDL